MVVKTQACKLLEAMCDNVDGSTSVVATFCCNALNAAMGGRTHLAKEGLWGME